MKKLTLVLAIAILLNASTVFATNWILTSQNSDGRFYFDGDTIVHMVNRNNVAVTTGWVDFIAPDGMAVMSFNTIRDADLAFYKGKTCVYYPSGVKSGCKNFEYEGLKATNYRSVQGITFIEMVNWNRNDGWVL